MCSAVMFHKFRFNSDQKGHGRPPFMEDDELTTYVEENSHKTVDSLEEG